MKKAQEKAQCKRAEETTQQHDRRLELHQVQEEAAQQREICMETESRRLANAATQRATQLNMSTEDIGIRRSANATRQWDTQVNEITEQQQTCRTADAN